MSLASSFSTSDVEVLESNLPYDGYFQIKQYRLKHKCFEGDWSKALTRELFKRGKAAGVLLYDPIIDAVVLIEQFRIGALEQDSPWLFEIVAGIIEQGEEPEDVAIREAYEESGAEIKNLTSICNYLVSPGGTDESVQLYCAYVDSSNLGGIHGLKEEGEDIKVHVVSRSDAYQAISQGKINNAATIIALQWLELNYEKLN